MNKTIFMVLVAISIVISGCNNQAKQQEIERQRQDSIQATELAEKKRMEQERAEREAAERAEKERLERISFTTTKGTFDIEQVLEHWYNVGVDHGASDKNAPHPSYKFAGHGTETKFKDFWASWYGIPNNEKAKDVYNRALKKYIQGYEDGWNF